jgi:hypothetical protein
MMLRDMSDVPENRSTHNPVSQITWVGRSHEQTTAKLQDAKQFKHDRVNFARQDMFNDLPGYHHIHGTVSEWNIIR